MGIKQYIKIQMYLNPYAQGGNYGGKSPGKNDQGEAQSIGAALFPTRKEIRTHLCLPEIFGERERIPKLETLMRLSEALTIPFNELLSALGVPYRHHQPGSCHFLGERWNWIESYQSPEVSDWVVTDVAKKKSLRSELKWIPWHRNLPLGTSL